MKYENKKENVNKVKKYWKPYVSEFKGNRKKKIRK